MLSKKKIKKHYVTFIKDINDIVPLVCEHHFKKWNIIKKNWEFYYKKWFNAVKIIKTVVDYFKKDIWVDINIVWLLGELLVNNIKTQNEEKKETKWSNKKTNPKKTKE